MPLPKKVSSPEPKKTEAAPIELIEPAEPIEPIEEPPVDEIIEETNNDELDVADAIVKAYNKGKADAKNKFEKSKNQETGTQSRRGPCFWCGHDRTCGTCRREDATTKFGSA